MTRTLTLRGIPDGTLNRLRARAAANRRSLNGELLEILDRAAAGGTALRVDRAEPASGDVALSTDSRGVDSPASAGARSVREASASYAQATSLVQPTSHATESPGCPDAIDRAALDALCRQHHIRWLAVFGSHARGDARPDSDVDVVVEFAPGRTPGLGIIRVANELAPVFGGRRVDLVTRRGLAPRLRDRVLASARTLYDADAHGGDASHSVGESHAAG